MCEHFSVTTGSLGAQGMVLVLQLPNSGKSTEFSRACPQWVVYEVAYISAVINVISMLALRRHRLIISHKVNAENKMKWISYHAH